MTSETLLEIIKDLEDTKLKSSIGDYYVVGFNEGLDRAISIIENVIEREG